jgi:hypothetical protein
VDEVKLIANLARKLFLLDGYHVPIVFVKGTKGKVFFQLVHFGETADERELDMLNAGTLIACKRNVGELELIILVNEAWMGTNINILPSEDPKRIEVLLINSLDARTKDEQLMAFTVKRDSRGNVIDLSEDVFPKDGSPKGKLLPAFQKGYQIVSPVKN